MFLRPNQMEIVPRVLTLIKKWSKQLVKKGEGKV